MPTLMVGNDMKKFKRIIFFSLISVLFTSWFITVKAATTVLPYVAKVTIFSCSGGLSSNFDSNSIAGHSWLLIQNLTNYQITVGKMNVNGYGSVTIGLWNYEHDGVHYNQESVRVNICGDYSGRVSLYEKITEPQLYTLNGYILDNDDYYSLLSYNCSSFASGAWNSFSSNTLSAIIQTPNSLSFDMPSSLCYHIRLKTGYQTNKSIPLNSNTGYYEGNTFISYSVS